MSGEKKRQRAKRASEKIVKRDKEFSRDMYIFVLFGFAAAIAAVIAACVEELQNVKLFSGLVEGRVKKRREKKKRQNHLPLLEENLEAVRNQNAEAHAGHIEHSLRHDKTHGEEEVGRRDERQDDQREGLKEKRLMMA